MNFRLLLIFVFFLALPHAARAEDNCSNLKPITGEINAEKVNMASALVDQCLDLNKSITVRVTSDGGDSSAGLAIYEMFSMAKPRVTTIAYGGVSSAATLVFLSGKERIISCSSYLIIHESSLTLEANTTLTIARARQYTQRLATLNERYLDIYAKVTKQPRAKLALMVERETVLSSQEALKLGFATKRSGC